MAARTIETRAVISAQDKTGDTFAQVARKLSQLENQTRAMDKRTATAQSAAANLAKAQVVKASQIPAFASSIAGTAAAIAGSYAVKQATARIIHKAAAEQHERMRMAVGGMSSGEIETAQSVAEALQSKYKPIGQTNIMHMLRNARSVVGSFEEAQHIMEPLLKLRMVAQGARPHAALEEINEDFDKLVKGLEIKGVTQNMPKFERYIDGMAKALNLFGDTLKPYEYYQMFKYGRAATNGLDEKFMLGVAPTLAQELGGSSAGKAFATFYSTIIGGRMKNSAAAEFVKLGLVDPSKIIKTKTGSVKGISPGGVSGADMARSNPYEWVQQYLLPAFMKHGITDENQRAQIIARLFGDQVAQQLVTIFATQQGRIDKDMSLLGGAKGTAAAADVAKTFDSASKALGNSVDRLATSMGRPFIDPLTTALNSTADAIDRWAAAIDREEHKKATGDTSLSPGQAKFNRLMNRAAGVGPTSQGVFGEPGIDRARQDKLARDKEDELASEIETRQKRIETLNMHVLGLPQNSPLARAGRAELEQLGGDQDATQARLDRMRENREAISRLMATGGQGFNQLRDYRSLAMNQPVAPMPGFPSKYAMPTSLGYRTARADFLGGIDPALAPPAKQEPAVVTLDPNSKVDVRAVFEVKAGSSLLEVVEMAKTATAQGNARASIGSVGKTGVGVQGD